MPSITNANIISNILSNLFLTERTASLDSIEGDGWAEQRT